MIQQWIDAGETQTQEFKSSFDKACIETLMAFANAKGGHVLVGVTDQGTVQGTTLRKKLVAEAFYLTTGIEKYGSGFIRIRKTLQDYPEVHFDIAEKFGGVMATFTKSQSESQDEGVSGGVKNTEDLSRLIATKPGMNTAALVVQSGVTQRTIERWLKQLKDQGKIEFRGAPKTGGYFSL